MILVDGTSLLDPSDLTRLSLRLSSSVGSWGRWVDDDHVAVPPSLLLSLAGPLASSAEWRAGFDGMLAYAAAHGWVSDDDGWVRMHVERG